MEILSNVNHIFTIDTDGAEHTNITPFKHKIWRWSIDGYLLTAAVLLLK